MAWLSAARVPLFGGILAIVATLGGCAGGVTESISTTALAPGSVNAAELRKAGAGALKEMALGNPNAPTTMIEYASLGCPICAAWHAKVFTKFKSAYIDTGKVYYIYREFPIGPSPEAAAHAARCVPEALYFKTNEKFMATRGQWNGRTPDNALLYKIVQDTGLTRAAFDSCMANQNIKDEIKLVRQRGREFGVKGTPTFFINGQHVRGFLSFEELQKLIDEQIKLAAKPV
jgi:protein-disulfide isomerase